MRAHNSAQRVCRSTGQQDETVTISAHPREVFHMESYSIKNICTITRTPKMLVCGETGDPQGQPSILVSHTPSTPDHLISSVLQCKTMDERFPAGKRQIRRSLRKLQRRQWRTQSATSKSVFAFSTNQGTQITYHGVMGWILVHFTSTCVDFANWIWNRSIQDFT